MRITDEPTSTSTRHRCVHPRMSANQWSRTDKSERGHNFKPYVKVLPTNDVCVCTEATSEILGGPEKYVTVGSSLRLVCVLRDNTQPPSYVFWYHGHQMINYHTTRQVSHS